jgi:hypothetical protein
MNPPTAQTQEIVSNSKHGGLIEKERARPERLILISPKSHAVYHPRPV